MIFTRGWSRALEGPSPLPPGQTRKPIFERGDFDVLYCYRDTAW